jgi:hypothetical protein
MKLTRCLLPILCLTLATTSVRSTTVIPPTFDELVTEAELIFQGAVTESHSQWIGEGPEHRIVTFVTFAIEDAIKGNPGNSYTIRMLGGTVGKDTMEVSDAPKFKVGDRDILFVEHNGDQFVPLVGIMHGRFHVLKDENGRETVAKDSGARVSNVATLGKTENATVSGESLSTADFKAAIRQRLSQAVVK